MAMTCRRCDKGITAGQIAHVLRGIVVCDECKTPGEKGFGERDGTAAGSELLVVPAEETSAGISLTPRRVEILEAARQPEELIIRQGNTVNMFDASTGRMRDSRSVVAVLRKADLVYWERLPLRGYAKESARWRLRLTVAGDDALNEVAERAATNGG